MSDRPYLGPWLIAFLGAAVLGLTLLLVAGCTTSINAPPPPTQGATGAPGPAGKQGEPGEKSKTVIIRPSEPAPPAMEIYLHH